MKLIKPSALGHFDERKKRHAIYSIDFQPNAGRLATGASDNSVKLWSVEELLKLESEEGGAEGGSGPQDAALLATLSNHTKSVNVVRWSTDGAFLASGSDDCYILIYKFAPGSISTSSFGSSSAQSRNKESWTRCATLQGHSMDILDVDWSPRGLLASASIDNTIMIWECKDLGLPGCPAIHNPLHVLRAHDNYVKGLSFDPLGKFLVSSGSDNIVNVWDADTWEVTEKLTEPMRNSMDRACSLFRRMSWSPDGQSFSVTACTKSSRPVGMLIKRGSWEPAIDLVGHEQPTLSTRFCPYVMQTEAVAAAVPATPATTIAGTAAGSEEAPSSASPSSSSSASKKNKGGRQQVPMCVVAMGDALGVLSVWTTGSAQAVRILLCYCP
jgi:protein HIRA/HIR1